MVVALFGAAVAWLIAAVTVVATGSVGWAVFCVGMALIFSVATVVVHWRGRVKSRSTNQQFNDLIRKEYRNAMKGRKLPSEASPEEPEVPAEKPSPTVGPVAIRIRGGSNARIYGNRAYGLPVLDAEDVDGLDAYDNTSDMSDQ